MKVSEGVVFRGGDKAVFRVCHLSSVPKKQLFPAVFLSPLSSAPEFRTQADLACVALHLAPIRCPGPNIPAHDSLCSMCLGLA